ncbi:hypothetical protein [Paenibacillus silagei]|uniref:ABC-type transport system substrate-binding protein n=1 Tax=Paenibacillus silagei TaxID=1670801 RepID=A0ABS4NZH3_9BACL|nr:hypothetical protein [Paenibacillus silagei]MBP2114657.1 ABC-type transport system substrate-binding protein [Paenibacillus silagei]
MKNVLSVIFAFSLLVTVVGCSSTSKQNSSGDWSSLFVVWNGDMYTFDNQTLDSVDEQIGEIEEFSDNEATIFSSKIFSNKYIVGTKIFKIKEVDPEESIAVEYNGKYYKGNNAGKYGS